ncbi:MAG: hypothetical protein H6736_09415 [Alphaproteobacteria bacterium]|nr:hypothetical protein [Alphaproteobacteria bacterium]MCB9692020.1 hypothetical protein [Alphaproteobacteria bacterium]
MTPYADLDGVRRALEAAGEPFEYGRSVEGRPLLGVEVGSGERTVAVTAGIHGIEHIGVRTALAVLRAPPEGVRLLVLPVLNPDGYARTEALGGEGPVAVMRKNARGVDLNRNFPMPWGARPTRVPFAGTDHPDAATYRGPHPLSEPETAALAALMEARRPHASVNLHSFMGTQITARVWHREDWAGYATLARAFRAGQGTRWGYPRLATPVGDVFTGELEDWQHHVLGCWATCIEVFSVVESARQHLRAPSSFWRFNPRDPDTIVARDAAGVRAWLRASLDLPPVPLRPGAHAVLAGSAG